MNRRLIAQAIVGLLTIVTLQNATIPAAAQQADTEKNLSELKDSPGSAHNTTRTAGPPANTVYDPFLSDSEVSSEYNPGGLWLTGNITKGLALLRWIVGPDYAGMLFVADTGRVSIRPPAPNQEAPTYSEAIRSGGQVGRRISSNEGLLLLNQIRSSKQKYLIHVGNSAPTLAGDTPFLGTMNLDNRYDSRITRYRTKADVERPPRGFDALIGLNTASLWFNLKSRRFVSLGMVLFHELAESYARVDVNLDYLPTEGRAGAHEKALAREIILRSQRRSQDLVTTLGLNLRLTSDEDLQRLELMSNNRW